MTPQQLPLVVDVPAGFRDNPALTGADVPQTITLQLQAKSGQVYVLPLSERAAQRIVLGLIHWPPVHDFLREKLKLAED
jgi:hypothetical protein